MKFVGPTLYRVALPSRGPRGETLPEVVKRFVSHDTFAAYLQVWQEAGHSVAWRSGTFAYISPVQA